jgi:oxygen-dependent protoporphyrinogen oxidase
MRAHQRAVVRGLARAAGGWRLTVGSAHARPARGRRRTGAPAAARLLAGVPGASAAVALQEIRYASAAIATLAYPTVSARWRRRLSCPRPRTPPIKAVTFSTVKWPHCGRRRRAGHVRSLGRIGMLLQSADEELAAVAAADLAAATGARGAPVASRVTRWGGGLPQYTVGHLDRVARIRAAVAGQPGLAVCGAAYDGVGIPACVATAQAAAGQIAGYLRDGRQWERHGGRLPGSRATGHRADTGRD